MKPDLPLNAVGEKQLIDLSATSTEGALTTTLESDVQKLSPQPTTDPHDPLNWPTWMKIAILIQTSLLAAIGGLNTATINPALVPLGKEFHISTVHASYQTTVCIALNGVAPWIWIPLANKYGRRPVYLFTTLLGFGSILACAYTKTFTQLIVARVFNGFFPAAFALGATTVTDLFFYHQRARAIGFFTITIATGSHIAPIVGGLIGEYLGWRWIFKFCAIVDAIMFVIALFCLPETLYLRDPHNADTQNHDSHVLTTTASLDAERPRYTLRTHISLLTFLSRYHKQLPPLRYFAFFLRSLSISYYPSVLIPAVYYGVLYGFASILPAVTVAGIFTAAYHWSTLTIGLTYGAALTIGGLLGECCAGWILDLLVIRAQHNSKSAIGKHHGHGIHAFRQAKPELRLWGIFPGELLVPSALLIYGFTIQYHSRVSWFGPIFAIGLACFGLQIVTTTSYTYSIDCYPERSGEIAQVFNFIRQMIGFTFSFYAIKAGEKIGFQFLFLIYAVIAGVLVFVPMVVLLMLGEKWRLRFGRRHNGLDTRREHTSC